MTTNDDNKLSILDFDELYQVCHLLDAVSGALQFGSEYHQLNHLLGNFPSLLDHLNETLQHRIDNLRDKVLAQ